MHPRTSPSARSRRAAATLTGLGLVVATVGSVGPATAAPAPSTTDAAPAAEAFEAGRYVVTLLDDPAASYDGGVGGLAATKPQPGESLDADSAPVRAYRAHLQREQREVAEDADVQVDQQYTAALNGFTADLTAEQAAELAAAKGVLAVTPDEARQLDTTHSPDFLGLTGPEGVWASLGGPDDAGEGVVVGILDSGITPESASFAGEEVTSTTPSDEVGATWREADGSISVQKADGDVFTGFCDSGPTFSADVCDDKLVSAQHFSDGFAANVPRSAWTPEEELSPRDADGHGTHTAGTAVGNDGVPMSVDGNDYGVGSGMAPGAKLAVYKVCHSATTTGGGCYTSDSVAAIDKAVLDGVDVLNFSISGSLTSSLDPVELAFMSAAASGVFVAASAGNSGPGVSTVAHNSPWLTTVAASTHFNYYGTVELGNGERYRGSSVSSVGLPAQTPLVLSTEAAAAGVAADVARLCQPGGLDPAVVTGTVVVCDRGVNARTEKSQVVRDAGGVGMVLANTSPSSLDSDVHYVPTVHVDEVAGAAIKAYAAGDGATAALLTGDQTGLPPLATPVVAGFSSRGPALAHGGDLLKPDISAPGVGVLAAVAPATHGGREFDFLSGTSMSSPHVAGLAALVLAERPEWSPMAVKSAMMTTAYDLKNDDGSTDLSRFTQGAGHVDPTRFLEPGLVYESDYPQWLSFLEGSSGTDLVDGVEPIDPTQLNTPSIAVGELLRSESVTRTVTATTPGLYRATVDVPGFTARVTPPVLNFSQAGQSKTFRVQLVRTTAPNDEYAQGTMTWTGRGTSARIPVVARPVSAAVPADVTGSVADGAVSFEVTPGQDAPIAMEVAHGFTAGERDAGVLQRSTVFAKEVVVPAGGTQLLRADLQAGEGSDDLDLNMYDAADRLVASSATGSADERIQVADVPAGTYQLEVVGYDVAETGGAYQLDTFQLAGPEGNATISPNPLTGRTGRPAPVTVSYEGLEEGVPHLAQITYAGTTRSTFVTVD